MIVTAAMPRPVLRAALMGLVLLSASACTSVYRNHGYVPTPEDLSTITVGVDTRDSVTEAIGPPGSTGVLNDSGFYYVATRMRFYGPREPQVVSRELLAISFDTSGVVRSIERFDLEDGRDVPLEKQVTSSGVTDKTFLRQLLGSLGNFNPNTVLNE